MAAVTVETTHSTYHFDTAAQRFTRLRNVPEASQLGGDGDSQAYEAFTNPEVGEPMMIHLINGKLRITTPVLAVRYH